MLVLLPMLQGGGSRTSATDVICPMYARVQQLQALAAEAAATGDPRPVMLCEYAHSMGNSTGNLDEYWSCFEGSPGGRIIGGFIWDWADQALLKQDTLPDGTQVGATGDVLRMRRTCCRVKASLCVVCGLPAIRHRITVMCI
jgi:beta-galactosidase